MDNIIAGLDKLTTDLATVAVLETTSRFVRGASLQKNKKTERRGLKRGKRDEGMFTHINRKKLNQSIAQERELSKSQRNKSLSKSQSRKSGSQKNTPADPPIVKRFSRSRSNHSFISSLSKRSHASGSRSQQKSSKSSKNSYRRQSRQTVGPISISGGGILESSRQTSYSKLSKGMNGKLISKQVMGPRNDSPNSSEVSIKLRRQEKLLASQKSQNNRLKNDHTKPLKINLDTDRPRIKGDDLIDEILHTKKSRKTLAQQKIKEIEKRQQKELKPLPKQPYENKAIQRSSNTASTPNLPPIRRVQEQVQKNIKEQHKGINKSNIGAPKQEFIRNEGQGRQKPQRFISSSHQKESTNIKNPQARRTIDPSQSRNRQNKKIISNESDKPEQRPVLENREVQQVAGKKRIDSKQPQIPKQSHRDQQKHVNIKGYREKRNNQQQKQFQNKNKIGVKDDKKQPTAALNPSTQTGGTSSLLTPKRTTLPSPKSHINPGIRSKEAVSKGPIKEQRSDTNQKNISDKISPINPQKVPIQTKNVEPSNQIQASVSPKAKQSFERKNFTKGQDQSKLSPSSRGTLEKKNTEVDSKQPKVLDIKISQKFPLLSGAKYSKQKLSLPAQTKQSSKRMLPLVLKNIFSTTTIHEQIYVAFYRIKLSFACRPVKNSLTRERFAKLMLINLCKIANTKKRNAFESIRRATKRKNPQFLLRAVNSVLKNKMKGFFMKAKINSYSAPKAKVTPKEQIIHKQNPSQKAIVPPKSPRNPLYRTKSAQSLPFETNKVSNDLQRQQSRLQNSYNKLKNQFRQQLQEMKFKKQELRQLISEHQYQVQFNEAKKKEYKQLLENTKQLEIETPDSDTYVKKANTKLPLLAEIFVKVYKNPASQIEISSLIEANLSLNSENVLISKWKTMLKNIQLQSGIDFFENNPSVNIDLRDLVKKETLLSLNFLRSYIREQYLWEWVHLCAQT